MCSGDVVSSPPPHLLSCPLYVFLQDIRIAMHKYKLFLSTNKTEDSLKTGEVLLGFFFREVHDHPIVAGKGKGRSY